MVDPSVPQSCFEDLAQRHDFLVHGVRAGGLPRAALDPSSR